MAERKFCPLCFSPLRKNGSHRKGQPKYECTNCGHQPSSDKALSKVSPDQRTELPLGRGLVVEAPPKFNLYLTSDWHCGQEACAYRELADMVRRIESDPTARVIIGGDQMEMTPPGYHDGGRDSTCYPDQQIIRTSEALRSIQRKIDLLYLGNHGLHRFVNSQIDPDLLLAYSLGVRYAPVPTVIQYRSKAGVVKIAGGHGRSGAQNSLLELNKLQTIFPGCDLYHLGHTHDLYAEQAGAMVFDEEGRERWAGTWMCRTGSFLKYPKYARQAMFKPKPIGYLVARIEGGKVANVEVVKA
jgi:hypothetical protein